jgi:hypothetical protein
VNEYLPPIPCNFAATSMSGGPGSTPPSAGHDREFSTDSRIGNVCRGVIPSCKSAKYGGTQHCRLMYMNM